MKIEFPQVVKGCVVPYSVQEKIAKEEQSKTNNKKIQTKQFLHDLTITIISVLLSNIDRIFIFVSNLIKNLIGE